MCDNLSSSTSNGRVGVSAFTLIEILVTVAIMTVLLSASVPALLSSQRAASLTQTGNTLADAITLARQTAMSKNTFTALLVISKAASGDQKQALIVLEFNSTDNMWKTAGGWVRIPEAATIVDLGSQTSILAPLDLKLDGKNVQNLQDSEFSTLVFYPDGRMENNSEPVRRLSARYTTDNPQAASGDPANYYDLVVNSNTSAFRIVRR